MRRFRRDPLGFLEHFADRSQTGVFRLPWGAWCVRDSELALKVLRDPVFNSGRSTFFGDLLPSRLDQVALGRAVRNTVRAHVPAYRCALARALADLPAVSPWPQSGLTLVHRATADLLLHPGAPAALRQLQARSVRYGLMRSPLRRHRLRSELLRPKLTAATTEEITDRRAAGVCEAAPRDVLDTVIAACPEGVTDEAAALLYSLLVKSVVGTVGHAVAWSLLLACLHQPGATAWPWPVDWITREAARHRPVVWMVGRPVPHPMEYGGIDFKPGAILSVSPYLLHHDQHLWKSPEQFRPDRWSDTGDHGPYLPFSAGPFTCGGAAVAQTMITEAVAALAAGNRLRVTGAITHPVVTDSAAPRPFALQRVPTR
ncbi:cytochrome P450 [Streptomyces tsukubensis]|uniref:Cytochrome n=1 Tax=Streptomyces tsukubensis TaxID=83656 RepID=A0A1V4AA14_9ACTN|nr:cytochrome P450 [Streptomyces tsukubensis]OON79298.1 cytochrome [Streptomyces tsukubensis]QFR97849.1 cytochrome P450 [Streptomyces tsukubensis]